MNRNNESKQNSLPIRSIDTSMDLIFLYIMYFGVCIDCGFRIGHKSKQYSRSVVYVFRVFGVFLCEFDA